MSRNKPRPGTVLAEIARLEEVHGYEARAGLMVVLFCLEVEGRTEDEVRALDLTRNGRRVQVQRLPGEMLNELEARANPGGCWRAMPMPICTREDSAMTAGEWDAAVAQAGQNWQGLAA